MSAVLLQVVPFFAIIGLGWAAGKRGFFPEEATNWLTRFVFFFALSAMLFRFAAQLPLGEVLDWRVVGSYSLASVIVYLGALIFSLRRGEPLDAGAFEAHCAVIGNIGFLGLPMLVHMMGEAALIVIMQLLAIDLLLFTTLLVIMVTLSRGGRLGISTICTLIIGVSRNPMMQAIVAGFLWSSLALPIPEPLDHFLLILGAAATPGALFAIGASLASKRVARPALAAWISFLKLFVHPAAVAVAAYCFGVQPKYAAVMIASSALPVAGNVFMQALHYGVAPQRVSAAILISTAISTLTLSLVLTEVLTW